MKSTLQKITLTTRENEDFTGYWHCPVNSAERPLKGKIIIASAMGATQNYYRPIAIWLAEQGFGVLTFDCRGMGESLNQPLRDYRCDILDWATQDYSAALQFVIDTGSTAPIFWLGNSLGGQIFPLIDNIEQVNKVISVSSGTGYWKRNVPRLRAIAPLLWYFIAPITIAMFGYFPGKKLGIIGNLPKQVMLQWRRWCLHPEYCVGVESDAIREKFQQVKVPLISIYFTDDEMLSSANMRDLHALFGNRNKTLSEISPSDMGEKQIGHLGFFRDKFKDNLWPKILLSQL